MADMETSTPTVVATQKEPSQPVEASEEAPLITPHAGSWRPESSVTRDKIKITRKSTEESRQDDRDAAPTSRRSLPATPGPAVPPSSTTHTQPSTPQPSVVNSLINPLGPRTAAVYPQHMTKDLRKVVLTRTSVASNRPKGFVSQKERLDTTLKDIKQSQNFAASDITNPNYRTYSTYTLRPKQAKLSVKVTHVKLESRKEKKEVQPQAVLRVPQNSAGSEAINLRNINLKRFYDRLEHSPHKVGFNTHTEPQLPHFTKRATKRGVLRIGKLSSGRKELPKPQATHQVGHIRNALEEMTERGPAVNVERYLASRLFNDLEHFRRTKTLLYVQPNFNVPNSGLFKIPGDLTVGEQALEFAKKDLTCPPKRSTTSLSKKSSQSEPIFPALSNMRFVSAARRSKTPGADFHGEPGDIPDNRGRSPDSVIRAVRSSNNMCRTTPLPSPLPSEGQRLENQTMEINVS